MTRSDQRAQEIVASKGYSKEGLIKRAIREKLILTGDIERHSVKIEPQLYGVQGGSSGIIAFVTSNGEAKSKITDNPDGSENYEGATAATRKGPEPVLGLQRLYFFEMHNLKLTEEHSEPIALTAADEDWEVILLRISQ